LALIRQADTHLVIGLRQPDDRLWSVLADANVRLLVALDDPRLAASEILASATADWSMAIRATANCCPQLVRYCSLPGALALHADRVREDIPGAVHAIARHLGIGLSDAQIATVGTEITECDLTRALASRDRFRPAIHERADRAIDGALAAYARHISGAEAIGQIVWNRELFFRYADGVDRPTGVIEIPGSPSTLIHGPYIHLPPGQWTAHVVLGISPQAVGNSFLIDAFAGTQLGHAVFVPERSGVYTVYVNFSIEQPSGLGLEIRVFTINQKPHGQLALGHVVLQPLSARKPEAFSGPESFDSVLEL
jgi:hypothetical protein